MSINPMYPFPTSPGIFNVSKYNIPGTVRDHRDATHKQIKPGDFIIINESGGSAFSYGFVTKLLFRTRGDPAIKFIKTNTRRREAYPIGASSYADYVPTPYNSSTSRLYKVLVVPEAAIDPIAVKVMQGVNVKVAEKTMTDVLNAVDNI